jgi:hypothetical protein
MRYMLLFAGDQAAFNAMAPRESQGMYGKIGEWWARHSATGTIVGLVSGKVARGRRGCTSFAPGRRPIGSPDVFRPASPAPTRSLWCRGDWTRTSDPLLPKQVRYHCATPRRFLISATASAFPTLRWHRTFLMRPICPHSTGCADLLENLARMRDNGQRQSDLLGDYAVETHFDQSDSGEGRRGVCTPGTTPHGGAGLDSVAVGVAWRRTAAPLEPGQFGQRCRRAQSTVCSRYRGALERASVSERRYPTRRRCVRSCARCAR